MEANNKSKNPFQKVGECLYRYSPNGVYYARFKIDGKPIKRSLETTDRVFANRKLRVFRDEQRHTDRSRGNLTLAELCDRYLLTIQHQKPKTIERKTLIVGRIKADWPTGRLTQVGKIRPSDADLWLSRHSFGAASRNLHIACIKDVFASALRDRIISASPVAHLKSTKPGTPIRLTPTFEQFKRIIADVRAQRFSADADDSADFLEFLGLCGLGQAEASSLTRGDVDFEAGRIITFRHKTKTGFAIPLYPQARALLERICAGKDHDERIFKIDNAKRALTAACKRLNLPAFSQRSFRRMFVTRAIERGVDVKVVAQWQGHRDGGKLILQTYSHVRPEHSNRMAQLMTDETPANVIPMQDAAPAGARS